MLRALRSCTRRGQRGQSLVEFALIAPILLLFVAVGGDMARLFFIGVDLTNSTREGALYAGQHASDVGQTQAQLQSQITTIMGAEEQQGTTPLKCPSEALSFSYSASNGSPPNVPPAAGSTTTVTVTATCTVTPLFLLKPLPTTYSLKSTARAMAVGAAQ